MESTSHSIGAAIIVKNAEKTIANTLNSIKDICKQIVIVDTGSEDKTPVICSRYGTELHFFSWQNDFSIARNYAIKFIRSDWILIIDADETLDQKSFINNLYLLNNPSTGGIRTIIRNFIQDTDTIKEHKYTRIFRNNKKFLFKGKIHEQISDSIEQNGYDIIDSEIIINHYGYSKKDEEKIQRNLELLHQELSVTPDDDWKKYHLAETEFSAGNYEKSKSLFLEILNSVMLSNEQSDMVKIRLGQLYLRDNLFDAASSQLNFDASNLQLEGLRKYILASALIMMKKNSDAAAILKSDEVEKSELINKHDLSNIKLYLEKIL